MIKKVIICILLAYSFIYLEACTFNYLEPTVSIDDSITESQIDEPTKEELPIFEVNGSKFIDYKKYQDIETLSLIKFGELKDAYVITSRKQPIYGGRVWNYINDKDDVVRVTYSSKDSKKIESIHVVYNDYVFGNTPLFQNIPYMTLDNWKKIHPIYNLNYNEEDCIVFSNRYSQKLTKEFFLDLGFEDDISQKLTNYSDVIPFYRLSNVSKIENKYKLYFVSDYNDAMVSYYGEVFLENDYLYFIDKNDIMIIDKGQFNSSYHYVFLTETKYLYDYISYTKLGRYNKYDDFTQVKNVRLSITYPQMNIFKLTGKYHAKIDEDKSKTFSFELTYRYNKKEDILEVLDFICK